MKRLLLLVALALPAAAQNRIASDFEIARMKQQIAQSKDFLSQLSGHLNLGDAYASRNEPSIARSEFEIAQKLASKERVSARLESDIARYATATAYLALAEAKLGDGARSFELAEEAVRYESGSAKTWNLYSSAMTVARQPAKAVGAARNAVAIATRERTSEIATQLDLAIYQYTLASALIETGKREEPERLLRTAAESLRSPAFSDLKRSAASSESFEIYSTARGDEAAYLSILNRVQLRLAALLEAGGNIAGAREQYQRVLETRTDDATALAGLARIAAPAEREQFFAAAFDANPFAISLIREYQRYLGSEPQDVTGRTAGARVRQALTLIARGQTRDARATIDALLVEYPNNETLKRLRRETETASVGPAELRALLPRLMSDSLSPEERTALDERVFVETVVFTSAQAVDGQTVLASGTIEGLPFRFAEPTAFRGTFTANTPLRLSFRVLGATDVNGADGLLIEPLGVAP